MWKPWAVWFEANVQPGFVSAPSTGCPLIEIASSANPAGSDWSAPWTPPSVVYPKRTWWDPPSAKADRSAVSVAQFPP